MNKGVHLFYSTQKFSIQKYTENIEKWGTWLSQLEEHTTPPQGHEFETHIGCEVYFKSKVNKLKKKLKKYIEK